MISAARLDHIAFGVSSIEFRGGQWGFCRGAMLEAIEIRNNSDGTAIPDFDDNVGSKFIVI